MTPHTLCSHATVEPPAAVIWHFTDGSTSKTTEDFGSARGLEDFARRAEAHGFGPRARSRPEFETSGWPGPCGRVRSCPWTAIAADTWIGSGSSLGREPVALQQPLENKRGGNTYLS